MRIAFSEPITLAVNDDMILQAKDGATVVLRVRSIMDKHKKPMTAAHIDAAPELEIS